MRPQAALAMGIPVGYRPSNGVISSWYGPRPVPPGMPAWAGFHNGIDFYGGPGKKTFASHPGRVAFAGRDGDGSYTIRIQHNGFMSHYAHNPAGGIRVGVGQYVEGGQHIGYEGSTGYATGDHLHYKISSGYGTPAWNINALFRDQGGNLPPGLSLVLNNTGRDEYILNRGQAAALAGAAGRGFPEAVTLVVEDGPTLRAYVEDVGDRRLASHVAGLAQPLRQHAGA